MTGMSRQEQLILFMTGAGAGLGSNRLDCQLIAIIAIFHRLLLNHILQSLIGFDLVNCNNDWFDLANRNNDCIYCIVGGNLLGKIRGPRSLK